MHAGKTLATGLTFDLLSEKYGAEESMGWYIKFANPIYQAIKALHRKDKPRVFMQRFGDLARREFGDDVFEKIFEENVHGFLTKRVPIIPQTHVVLMTDDLRFYREYELVKRLGFVVVKIEADEEVRRARGSEAFVNLKHRSEAESDLFTPDFIVENNIEHPFRLEFKQALRQLYEDNKLLGD
jgi:hypothetical protein